jgi:mRNA interferase RelE/StbE
MATYKVVLKPSVEKDFRPLPKSMVERIMKRIGALSDDPFPDQSVKLAGTEQTYRIRVGDYRVIYGVDKADRQIIIHYIRHRREVYRRV